MTRDETRFGGSLPFQVRGIIQDRERQRHRAQSNYKAFAEDVLVWLRAVTLVISTVGDGWTHREKDARMRSAVAMCESAVSAVRNHRQDHYDRCDAPDLFKSDFDHRELIDRVRELEAENAALRKQVEEDAT